MSQAELIEKKSKEDVPTMFIEVLATGDSGYVRDDTRGTPYQESINCAEVTFIPNRGKMAKPISYNDKGEPTAFRNVDIRYIKDCPYIEIEEQKKNNYEPSTIKNNDAIVIKKGKAMIKREGDIALFDYIQNVFYNQNAPNRPRSAKALIKVVELEKKVSLVNENVFLQARAITAVEKLVLKQPGKTVSYKYQESKIDNLLTALNKFGGDNYSDKISVLTACAKADPQGFLDIAAKLDNITITEITHALELNVVAFEGSTLQYVDGKAVVCTIDNMIKAQASKIAAASDLLKTPEYAQAYTELKAKLEIAQEKQLK